MHAESPERSWHERRGQLAHHNYGQADHRKRETENFDEERAQIQLHSQNRCVPAVVDNFAGLRGGFGRKDVGPVIAHTDGSIGMDCNDADKKYSATEDAPKVRPRTVHDVLQQYGRRLALSAYRPEYHKQGADDLLFLATEGMAVSAVRQS